MISTVLNDNGLSDKLRVLSSGLGNIFQELLSEVGAEMSNEAKALAPVRTGRLKNNIKFIFDKKDNLGALTTQKSLAKGNVWYSRIVESDRNITAKKKEYLTFRINGNWVKVKSVRVKGQPFITPVFNDYFSSESSKGYKKLQEALMNKIENELS